MEQKKDFFLKYFQNMGKIIRLGHHALGNVKNVLGKKDNKAETVKLDNETENVTQKKNKFIIKEDETNKIYNYNADYDDDDDEEEDRDLDKDKDRETTDNPYPKCRQFEGNIQEKITNDQKDDQVNGVNQLEYDESDIWETSHRILLKNTIVDVDGMSYVKCYKMKPVKKDIFSFVGFGKTNLKEVNYLALLDEFFLYMIKDIEIKNTAEPSDKKNLLRIVDNHHDLRQISNLDIQTLNNKKTVIKLLFVLNNDVDQFKSKVIEIFFDKNESTIFLEYLRLFFKRLKIPIHLENCTLMKN